MNPHKVLEAKTFIVHESCADGVVSALLLHDINPKAKILPCQYGTPQHKNLPVEEGTVFADFSPSLEQADVFQEAGAVVFDHHRTQKEIVDRFGEDGVYSDEPGVCGATLVYQHVYQPLIKAGVLRGDVSGGIAQRDQLASRMAILAGVRDTWQTKDSRWEESGVQTEVMTFFSLETFLNTPLQQLAEKWDSHYLWVGEALWARKKRKALKAAESGHTFTTSRGTRVLVLMQGGPVISDASEALGDRVDIVLGAFYTKDPGDPCPRVVVSCRSRKDYDVSKLCRYYKDKGRALSGGGHRLAAGMVFPWHPDLPNPITLVENLVEEYEAAAY